MKRILSGIISLIMILASLPSAYAAVGDVTSHYVSHGEFACVEGGNEKQTGLYSGTRFDVWSRGQSPADPKNPVKAAFWNFDVTDYVTDTQEISKAVLLFAALPTDYSSSINLYNCEEKVKTGSNYLNTPTPDTSSAIKSFSLQNVTSVSGTYTDVPEKYNVAVNISTYVKNKAKEKDTDFTFMMYPKYGGSVYGFIDVPVLYVETTETPDRSNIISPVASVYTGSKIPTTTKPVSGGGFLYAEEPIDPSNPGQALFYKFDLSKYTKAGTSIDKAEFMQLTNDPGYARLFKIYEVPENDLENGQVYADVSTPSADAKPIAEFDSPGASTVIDTANYPGVEYEYNMYKDFTDYVQEKISLGQDSFTLMVYAGWGTTAGYDLLSPPVLYITPGVTNPDAPVVKLLDETDKYKDSEKFVLKVEATDSNGIGDIAVYLDGEKKEGTMTSEGDVHTFTAPALDSGNFEMKIVVSDIYGKSTTITKNITVSRSKAIVSPVASVYTGNQIPTTTKPISGGGFLYAKPVNPADPGKALFYKFDLSEFVEQGIGIESVHYMQMTNNPGYSRLFCIYDIPENDLENGQKYADVSTPSADATPVKKISSPGGTSIDRDSYPGVEKDYNFFTDISSYVKGKLSEDKSSFTLMIYAGYGTTAGYDLLSAPVLYVKLGEVNLDNPKAKLISDKDVYKDREPLEFQIEATDSNGIGSIDIYIDGVKKAGTMTSDGDIYTYKTGAPNAGTYQIKIVVSDKYGKGTTLTKTITVEHTRDVLEPVAWAYTHWGDETQTSAKYTPPNKSEGYWLWANSSSMWKEPLRAMYVKFDISDYIDAGYTISRACLVQGAQTGGQAYMFAVDCPDNDLVMGDVYNTVPKHNTNNIAGSYDIGTVTSTYRNEVDMQLTCPGVKKDNNAVFDISKYVANKITSGENSFTLMEFPRYAGGYVWLYNVPQLYIEFTKGSDIEIIDTSKSVIDGQNAVLSAKVTSEADIKNVQFYIDDVLAGETSKDVDGIYAVSAEPVAAGTYTLKVIAETYEGGKSAETTEFVVETNSATLSDKTLSDSTVFVKDDVSYFYIAEGTTVGEFEEQTGFTAVARDADGNIISGTDELVSGTVCGLYDEEGAYVGGYVITDSGYVSDITLDITFPDHNGLANAKAYMGEESDMIIFVAGYDGDRLVSANLVRYEDVIGDVELSAEVERNGANRFKAFIFDGNMKPLTRAAERKTQVAILRFDDFTIYSYEAFDKMMTYLDEEGIKGAFGAIGITLDPDNEANASISGYTWHYNRAIEVLEKARDDEDVEIWMHGYVHAKEEFNDIIENGYTYDQQKESFDKFMAIMKKHGIEIRTFAPPNDSESQTTVKVISENYPQIDTVMHFDYLKMAEGMINLENDASPEKAVDTIKFDTFVKNYWNNENNDYIQILSHPGLWDDTDWAEYKKIVDFLQQRGAIFMTPSEYHDSLK